MTQYPLPKHSIALRQRVILLMGFLARQAHRARGPLRKSTMYLDRRLDRVRAAALLLLFSVVAVASARAQGPDDRQLARAIWCRDAVSAIVHVTVRREDGAEAVGTAFRISPRYALTARHLVGRVDIHGTRLAAISTITVRFDGPGSPAQALDPQRVQDAANGDIAVLDLGHRTTEPPFFSLGNSYTVKRDDFLTFYGYGLGEPGAMRFGRVDLPDSENGQIRAEVNSQRGFSGAPVLNRRGNVVGVLSAGTPGMAYIAPVHHAEAELRLRGVRIPEPEKEVDQVAGRTTCPETRADSLKPTTTTQQPVGGPQVTTHGPGSPGVVSGRDATVTLGGVPPLPLTVPPVPEAPSGPATGPPR